ncbi:MAG: hypothetical protein R2795_06945 [Saprospiraceae bacterium]
MANSKLNSTDVIQLISNYESKLRQLRFEVAHTQQTLEDLKAMLATTETEEKQTGLTASHKETAKKSGAKADKPAKKSKKNKKEDATKDHSPVVSAVAPAKEELAAAEKPVKAPSASPKTKTANTTKTAKPAKAAPTAKPKKVAAKPAPAKKTTARRPRVYKLSEYDNYLLTALEQRGKASLVSEINETIAALQTGAGKIPNEQEITKMVVRSLQKLANKHNKVVKMPYEGKGFQYALPNWVGPNKALKKKHQRS